MKEGWKFCREVGFCGCILHWSPVDLCVKTCVHGLCPRSIENPLGNTPHQWGTDSGGIIPGGEPSVGNCLQQRTSQWEHCLSWGSVCGMGNIAHSRGTAFRANCPQWEPSAVGLLLRQTVSRCAEPGDPSPREETRGSPECARAYKTTALWTKTTKQREATLADDCPSQHLTPLSNSNEIRVGSRGGAVAKLAPAVAGRTLAFPTPCSRRLFPLGSRRSN